MILYQNLWPEVIHTAIKEIVIMEMHNITDYRELYATFARIKVQTSQQDYIVLPGYEDESDEKDRKYYN